jgi:pre-mRNA-processing factor 40
VAGSVAASAPNNVLHQQHPQVPTAAPTVNGSYTAQQIDQAWREYTAHNGVTFYHNAILGDGTFTKPAVMTKQEAATSVATTSSNKRTWQEYHDANSGRKYYSDGVTTTWEKPQGYVSPDVIVARTSLPAKDEPTEPSKKKKRTLEGATSKKELITFDSKSEATAAFKGLLLAKGISPSLKWNEVVKVCESDAKWGARWEACADVMSVGERRQALAEYQTKRANEIRDEERKERARAKEAFGQMLTDVLPKIPGFSPHTFRFTDVRPTLANDERFFAVEEEGIRETLFLDFCDDSKKREERNKRTKKKEAQDSFVSFLKEKLDGGSLTYASTWESFLSLLSETEKADPRFCTSIVLPDSDRQLYFADFVLELQNLEDDKRRRIREARRRAEKAQRDNFRRLLREKAAEGMIFPHTRWRVVEEFLAQDEAFAPVVAQGSDLPRELFEQFVDEWDDIYRRERSFLSHLLESQGKAAEPINQDMTFDSFKELLIQGALSSGEFQNDVSRIISCEDPVSSARLFYDELISRAASERDSTATQFKYKEESSEDEGEIIEEGEISENEKESKDNNSSIPTTNLSAAAISNAADQDQSKEAAQETQELSKISEVIQGAKGAPEIEVSENA